MTRMVRGALLQATYTGDKESMIDKHIRYARQAAEQILNAEKLKDVTQFMRLVVS